MMQCWKRWKTPKSQPTKKPQQVIEIEPTVRNQKSPPAKIPREAIETEPTVRNQKSLPVEIPEEASETEPTIRNQKSSPAKISRNAIEKKPTVQGVPSGALPKCIVAVMGPTGSGKSTFIRTVTEQEGITIDHDLTSTTAEVEVYHFGWKGRTYELVDTPGFDDTYTSNTDILRKILRWLESSYKEGQRIHGLIYFHRISDPRLQGSAKQNLHIFRKICGNDCLKNVILATTFWDLVDTKTGINRETQLTEAGGFWDEMIRRGSRVARLDLSRETSLDLLESFTPLQHILPQAQEEVIVQSKSAEHILIAQLIDSKEDREMREIMMLEEEKHRKQMELLAEEHRSIQVHYSREEEQRKDRHATGAREFRAAREASMNAFDKEHRAQLTQLRQRGVEERVTLERELNRKQEEVARLDAERKRLKMKRYRRSSTSTDGSRSHFTMTTTPWSDSSRDSLAGSDTDSGHLEPDFPSTDDRWPEPFEPSASGIRW